MDAKGIRERAQTDPKALEEILASLVKEPPEGVESLMRDLLLLYRDDKACLKAIKRAIFKLGQKGIRVEVGGPEAKAPRLRKEETKGYLGLLDPSGRLFVAIERQALMGLVGYFALGSFWEGIADFQRATTSKKAWREFLQGVQKPYLPPYKEVPAGYAKEILEEWARMRDHKGLREAEEELKALSYQGPKPLVLQGLSYDQLPEGDPQKDIRDLFRGLPFFGLWALVLDEVEPYYREMRSALQSPLALTEAQRAQRLDSIWQKAIEKLFTPQRRQALKRGLEEAALILPAERRESILRLAKGLETPPSPLKVNPLLKAILSLAFRALESEEKKEKPLVLRP